MIRAHTSQPPRIKHANIVVYSFLLYIDLQLARLHVSRISSRQIAPSSLDSGLSSNSPSLVACTGSDHEEGRLFRHEPLPKGTPRGKPKGIPRAGSAMTRRRGSAMTHHDLIRMTVDSRVLGHPQSRQINPNRGPSRAPTGLNPPPSPSTPLYWERRLISCFRSCIPRWPPLPMGPRHS